MLSLLGGGVRACMCVFLKHVKAYGIGKNNFGELLKSKEN